MKLPYTIDDIFGQSDIPEAVDLPDLADTPSFQDVGGDFQSGQYVGGQANFQDVKLGGTTTQYQMNNSGIFSFGDGSDGDVVISVNTTLSSDKYYNNLTVNSTKTLDIGGYRIFVKGTLTLNGKIYRDGSLGGASGLADGYLKGVPAPGAGGGSTENAAGSPGGAGIAVSNSLGSGGSAGQAGGDGNPPIGGRGGGAGGAASSATASNVKLIANWHLATLLDIASSGSSVKFTGAASAGGGGGGGDANAGDGIAGGGGGGRGGCAGGIVAIYAKNIIIGAGGSITANGENGLDGGSGLVGINQDGNGGGGAGGNGGIIILVYNSLTNNGSITVNAGTGGQGGGNGGTGKTAANSGSAGTIYYFQLSL